MLAYVKKLHTFAPAFENGAIAQLVEQRTENPCVPGSIPGGTTKYQGRLIIFGRPLLFLNENVEIHYSP
jgi:hypothetical protein